MDGTSGSSEEVSVLAFHDESNAAYLLSGDGGRKKYRANAGQPFLVGNTPRNHIELSPSPEKRSTHTDRIAVGDAAGTIVCL